MQIRKLGWAIVAGVLFTSGSLAGLTMAHAGTQDTTVHGCFNNSTGQLRVLTGSAPSCDAQTETPLSWDSQQPSTRWYRDYDHDGYGDWYQFVDSPAQPPGFVANNTDCNDGNANINPGVKSDPGPEDLNCNGVEAEDQLVTWYRDADNDGWGNASNSVQAALSAQPIGYVHRYGDCNDHNAAIHPYQAKCHSDGDIDGDGHRAPAVGGDDCDDTNANEFPGNTEVANGYGWDHECDPTTGGMLLFDPFFLDERPHDAPVMGYRSWRGNRLIGGIRTGLYAGAAECAPFPGDYQYGVQCQALDHALPKVGFPVSQ